MVKRTCNEWGYEIPNDEYYKKIYERLPYGLQAILSFGLSADLIDDVGLSNTKSAGFRPYGVPKSKGPYSWFEHDNANKQPRPCWEYYVHISEYIRLYESFKSKNIELKFEDNLMDIGLYKDGNLWVCCEIKEKSSQAKKLIREIKQYQIASELPDSDRGNDYLRKAKYIAKFKPEYFFVVSLGRRYEFRVEYPPNLNFQLVEDLVPLI
jgi:hypothetical protein